MHDIIIVGGGVAGCQTARLLSDCGLDVVVIEKERNIMLKDSGIVSAEFLNYFPKYLIAKNIDSMKIVSQCSEINISSHEPFAHIIHRESFSSYLRKNLKILYETAIAAKFSPDSAAVMTDKGFHEGKIIIGCDGVNSVIRKAAGIKSPRLYTGLFSRGKKRNGEITVFMNKFFSPDFFAWHIPYNGEHGLITAIRPKAHLEDFEQSCGFDRGVLCGSQIPIGMQKSFSERCLLVGDAASQVKPLTGGGIIFSLRAAKYAAEVAKEALDNNKFNASFMSQYESSWHSDFGAEIRKQFMLRNAYRKLTNKQIDDIFSAIKPVMEDMPVFNYDHLSKLCWKMPKLKLIRFLPWLFLK